MRVSAARPHLRLLVPVLAAAAARLAGAAPAQALTWGPEERLTTTSTDSETGLNHTPLAVDGSGTLHVVWAEQDGVRGNYQVYTRRRTAGVWLAPALVVPFRPEEAGSLLGSKFPSIVCDVHDTLHVAWHDYRIGGINNSEIYYKACFASSAWDTAVSAEIRLTTTNHPETGGDNSYVPTLAGDRYGALHLTWYDFRYGGSAAEILSKSRTGGAWDTTPGDAADLDVSNTVGDSGNPAVSIDFQGDLHVAWQDDTSGSYRILHAVRDAVTGAVSASEPVSTGAAAAVSPALAIDGTGTLLVAWVDSRDGSRRIYTRTKPYGGAWSPERPATPAGLNADEPALAVDAFGRAYLAWHDTRISAVNREVFLQRKERLADWDSTGASDFRVSNGTGASVRPSLLIDPAGRLDVIWKDRRDGNNEIYFREAALDVPTGVDENRPRVGPRLVATANPFTDATTFVPGGWPRGEGLTCSIFSADGRRVRELVSAESGALRWDGTDAAGIPVPSGVYFVKAASGGASAVTTVVRVR